MTRKRLPPPSPRDTPATSLTLSPPAVIAGADAWDADGDISLGPSLIYQDRSELPPPPTNGLDALFALAEAQEVYKYFLSLLLRGASLASAAASVRLTPALVYSWCRKGRQDILDGVDSYYSRWMYDYQAAVGRARVQAEMVLYSLDPEKYLGKGEGRLLGTEFVHKDQVPVGNEDTLAIPLAPHQQEGMQTESEEVINAPTKILGALEALKAAGALEDPTSWLAAAHDQTPED